jgi:hypothetical protein
MASQALLSETIAASPAAEPVKAGNDTNDVLDKVFKPSEMYSTGKASPLFGGGPTSLNRLMSGRSSMGSSVRSAFAMDLSRRQQQQKKDHSVDMYGYGYGYGADEEDKTQSHTDESPVQKRRRFQRRNSKTPAMLMALNSPLLLHLDFLEDKKEQAKAAAASTTAGSETATTIAPPSPASPMTFSTKKGTDIWDGGLEIAEELVMHLQKRRKSNS